MCKDRNLGGRQPELGCFLYEYRGCNHDMHGDGKHDLFCSGPAIQLVSYIYGER